MVDQPLNGALSSYLSKIDLVGPTASDDVRRAIGRYGAKAVKVAVIEQTKRKRGRPPEHDFRELRGVIELDARDWIEGRDPFKLRTNYSIAQEFSQRCPGHNPAATQRRIMGKLSKKREWMMLVTAEQMTRAHYPYAENVRALNALIAYDSRWGWDTLLEIASKNIADYTSKLGAPVDELTMKQIEEGARNALLALRPPAQRQRGGIFGPLSHNAIG